MIELGIQIKNEVGTDKISVEMFPRDSDANPIEKDVLSGLFPHVVDLLNGLLGGEGFRKMEKIAKSGTDEESPILNRNGIPVSIPMTKEYLMDKGLIEPEGGVTPIGKDSVIIVD
jgi:hypothetical protein